MAGRTKGIVIKSRLRFVRETFGDDALERILGTLSAADRDVLNGILLPSGWYPKDVNARLDEAIIEVMGDESPVQLADHIRSDLAKCPELELARWQARPWTSRAYSSLAYQFRRIL